MQAAGDFDRPMRPFGWILAHACALVAGAALMACGGSPWPDGALLLTERDALVRLLNRLERLEKTPLAREAAARARALPDCSTLRAHAPEGGFSELVAGLACDTPEVDFTRLERERGDHDLALLLPVSHDARLLATLSIGEDGDVDLALRLPDEAFQGILALLSPAGVSPGPGVLSVDGSLIHARVRARHGLAIADWIAPGGQADRLFRLKSELFAGAVLDGTWEMAVYIPSHGGGMPPAALALGFRARDAAVVGMESFIAEIVKTWPVHRSPFSVGSSLGACLLDLNLMPELAPCYVALEDALVVSWNPASLRRALAGETRWEPDAGSAAVIELARFAEADARLAKHLGVQAIDPTGVVPWSRMSVQGRPEGGLVELHARLEGSPGDPR
jgi:hypothetical protein